jgi:hypothetical protein
MSIWKFIVHENHKTWDNMEVRKCHSMIRNVWCWRTSHNNSLLKRDGGIAQVVECLPWKCEALSSSSNTYEIICWKKRELNKLFLWTRNLDIMKMSVHPTFFFRFNVILVALLFCFARINRLMLILLWKLKSSRRGRIILKNLLQRCNNQDNVVLS